MGMMSGAPTSIAELRKNDPKNAAHMWKRRAAATPDAIAFRYHDGGGWRSMTFGEADVAAEEIAGGLVARGVAPGDRVCLVSQTRLEWVLCDLGVLLAGGVTVPIYSSNTAEQSEFIIRDAGAKLVIVEDAVQRDKLLALRQPDRRCHRHGPDGRRRRRPRGVRPVARRPARRREGLGGRACR